MAAAPAEHMELTTVVTSSEPRCSVARRELTGSCSIIIDPDTRKRIFPIDKLTTYFNREKCQWILDCGCDRCNSESVCFHTRVDSAGYTSTILGRDTPRKSRSTRASAISLFGLVVFLQHPRLIIGFVDEGVNDTSLQELLRTRSLDGRLEDFKSFNPHAFTEFEENFRFHLPEFAVPFLDSLAFTKYAPNTILPFIGEKKIGHRQPNGEVISEGNNGSVYSFKIHGAYQKLPKFAANIQEFARKELDNSSKLQAYLEETNLQHVTQLENKHIVKVIKAYRLGETFNFIFPLAKTNLDHYLREPCWRGAKYCGGPVELSGAWQQLLGIAKAVGVIGGYGAEGPGYRGYHFDLKPANILVEQDDTWVITDFGTARFIPFRGSSTRVVNQGGTDAYAPPEIDNLDERFSSRYDVWSLGCIFLEVLAFVLRGPDGLTKENDGLDYVRRTTGRHVDDSRFFIAKPDHTGDQIKPAIDRFIRGLESSVRSHESTSREFVSIFTALIRKMLEPVAESRITIGVVIETFESLLRDVTVQHQPKEEPRKPYEFQAAPDERPLGSIGLHRFQPHIRAQGRWEKVDVRVFENTQGDLRVCTHPGAGGLSREKDLTRLDNQLIPRYAYDTDMSHYHAFREAIYFSHINPARFQKLASLVFSFAKPEDETTFQSVMTSQTVLESFPLRSVICKRTVDHFSKLKRLFKKTFSADPRPETSSHSSDLGPGRVQLWIEVVDETPTPTSRRGSSSSTSSSTPRPVREEPRHEEATKRRVVLFLPSTKSIITLKGEQDILPRKVTIMADCPTAKQNWHIDADDADPLLLNITPTQKENDPHFTASELQPSKPDDPDCFAGIPLSPEILDAFEAKTVFECNSIHLRFAAIDDAKAFLGTYKTQKTLWRLQRKELEQRPGYGAPRRADQPALTFNYPTASPVSSPQLKTQKEMEKPMARRGGGRGSFGGPSIKVTKPPIVDIPKDKGKGKAPAQFQGQVANGYLFPGVTPPFGPIREETEESYQPTYDQSRFGGYWSGHHNGQNT